MLPPLYADDVELLAELNENLDRMVGSLDDACRRMPKVNRSKIKP